MLFEEALRTELAEISEINNKTFMIIAPQKTEPPFVCYKEINLKIKRTLCEVLGNEGSYILSLVVSSPMQLLELKELIKIKLLSFRDRKIGDDGSGPYVENITVEFMDDIYEPELNMFRKDIKITVDY